MKSGTGTATVFLKISQLKRQLYNSHKGTGNSWKNAWLIYDHTTNDFFSLFSGEIYFVGLFCGSGGRLNTECCSFIFGPDSRILVTHLRALRRLIFIFNPLITTLAFKIL